MKKKMISSILLSLFLAFNTALPAYAINNEEKATQYNNLYEENQQIDYSKINEIMKKNAETLCNSYGAASVQYAVMDGDNIVVSDHAGLADKENSIKPTEKSMYGICSNSKMFTTTAVMQLVDEGKIDLDVPLTTYIPDFKMADPRYVNITPRMLINHSSGLMGCDYRNISLMNDVDTTTHDNLLISLAGQRLKADPGEFSVYCNDGFSLAEILIERLTNMSFSEYVRNYISKPLNLDNTKTAVDQFDKNKLAKTYLLSDKEADPEESFMALGTGGIYSTAEELCKFQRAITRKDGKGLLSSNSIDRMAEKEYLKGMWVTDGEDNSIGYGLGWDSVNLFPFNRYNIKALTKGGDSYVYHSSIITLPDLDLNVAVMSSGLSSDIDQSLGINALINVLKEKKIIKEELEPVKFDSERSQTIPPDQYDFQGFYNLNSYTFKAEINDDNQLVLSMYLDPEQMKGIDPKSLIWDTFHHTSSGYFMSNTRPNKGVRFVREGKNNRVYLELKSYNDEPFSQTAASIYFGEKIENPYKPSDIWGERAKHMYYVVNEKYSSLSQARGISEVAYKFLYNNLGFLNGDYIYNDDNNVAKAFISLPGSMGRDLNDYIFFKEDNKDYVKIGSYKLISDDSIKYLPADTKEIIIDSGETQWFKVPDELAGKTISVSSSKQTSFNVYNLEDLSCRYNSYVKKIRAKDYTLKDEVTLKNNDIISFNGNTGEKFEITIK